MIKYFLMILIVSICAGMDFFTGFAKAYVTKSVKSRIMRIGGVHKVCEIITMFFVCFLGVALDELGKLYNEPLIPTISGKVVTYGCCGYITLMELISICENLSAVFPNAKILSKIVKVLDSIKSESEDE